MRNKTLSIFREELFKTLPNKSIAIIHSGKVIGNTVGNDYPFEVDRDFYYFTGIDHPDCIFVIVKSENGLKEKLFIPSDDEDLVKWVGRNLNEKEAREISGIEKIAYSDTFDNFLFSLIKNYMVEKIFICVKARKKDAPKDFNGEIYIDLKERFPFAEIKNLESLTHHMRKIKDDEEISNILKAAIVGKKAFEGVLKTIKEGLSESLIKIELEYIVKKLESDLAFNTIVASGENGTILHYEKGESYLKNGDMVLMDFGCSFNKYCCDISRTVPVNGKFTPRQKELYEIVLLANKTVINNIKPGIKIKQLNKIVLDVYEKELKRIGLITSREEIEKYYYHGVSHSIGLETHDPFDNNLPLVEGNIITVEPGLYIQKEKIGIRIEDDVLVTKNAGEVLTCDIIKEVKDIEEYMKATF